MCSRFWGYSFGVSSIRVRCKIDIETPRPRVGVVWGDEK